VSPSRVCREVADHFLPFTLLQMCSSACDVQIRQRAKKLSSLCRPSFKLGLNCQEKLRRRWPIGSTLQFIPSGAIYIKPVRNQIKTEREWSPKSSKAEETDVQQNTNKKACIGTGASECLLNCCNSEEFLQSLCQQNAGIGVFCKHNCRSGRAEA